MVTNLFSIFDPSSSYLLLNNWISALMGLMLFPFSFWLTSSRWEYIFKNINMKLFGELAIFLKAPSLGFIFISIFLFIFTSNILGLVPYVFTSSAHLVYSLSVALPLWLAYTLFQWIKNFHKAAAHMVPKNTPSYLMMFMALVETISTLIRPITLAVRLAANMIAGHLLMTLLSNMLVSVSFMSQALLTPMLITLLTLEIAVASIQAYVFVVLSVLYASEV